MTEEEKRAAEAAAAAEASAEVNLATLEKSWNDSKAVMDKLLAGDAESEEDLAKAKSAGMDKGKGKGKKGKGGYQPVDREKDDDNDGDDDEDEGKDDDEEEDEEKSISDEIAASEDGQDVLELSGFLRDMTKAIDRRFESITKTIKSMAKSVKTVADLQKAQASMLGTVGEMQKAANQIIDRVSKTKLPSSSILSKSLNGKYVTQGGEKTKLSDLTKAQILEKALDLAKLRKISADELTNIERRVNAGAPLEPRYEDLIVGGTK